MLLFPLVEGWVGLFYLYHHWYVNECIHTPNPDQWVFGQHVTIKRQRTGVFAAYAEMKFLLVTGVLCLWLAPAWCASVSIDLRPSISPDHFTYTAHTL